MKRFVIIFTLLFMNSCSNEKEIILAEYGNGQVHELLLLTKPITKDSIGIKRIFFENGDLQCEGGYKQGVKHGSWICYNRNKEIKWQGSYNEGIEHGEFFCAYQNGAWKSLKVENGFKFDETVEYNFDSIENSFYYVYGQYDHDLETGLWSWQDTLGRKIKEMNFDKGINTGYVAFYYPNGNIKMKGNGYTKEGEDFNRFKDTLFFFNEEENGKIDSIEVYKDGRRLEKIHLYKK